MKITPDLLVSAVGCARELAELYAPHLDAACAHFQIDSAARLAAFLAQVGHESGGFRWTREIWGPTPAQLRYEGRADLGNTQPGDGQRFRGRGLIQLTGRDNYRRATERMAPLGVPDLEDFPEALEEPRWAAWSAADWWAWRGLNGMADVGEFDAITRRINGGTNGAADRRARWERAKVALAHVDAPDTSAQPVEKSPENVHVEKGKPMAPFLIPAVIELAKLIPKLGGMFGGSEVAQRNVAAAGVVVDAVVGAVGASNAQEAVEKIAADPVAREAANKAVEEVWYQITEAGSGGIDGARKADRAATVAGDMLHSPSFWVTLALLPLVYLVVGSVVGLWGEAWPSDVRAAIATAVVSLIVGGAAGYYWGQTTSRNRAPS